MASAMYPAFKERLLSPGVDLLTADVRAQLIDSADETYNAADVFMSDITAAAKVGSQVALASKTVTNGVFDAANTTIPGVTGDGIEAVLLYIHTGVDATARLIALLDGVTFTPNSGDCIINWDNGASKIFAL